MMNTNAVQNKAPINNGDANYKVREPTELEIMTGLYWGVSFTYNGRYPSLRKTAKMTVSEALLQLRTVLEWQGKHAKQIMLFERAKTLNEAIIKGSSKK